jgi:ferrous iron transport protein B
MFQFAFAVSEPFVVIIEKIFEMLGAWSDQIISNPYLASFVSLGIIGGLGSVLVFIPPIFGLFLALSILEDSGFMVACHICGNFTVALYPDSTLLFQ